MATPYPPAPQQVAFRWDFAGTNVKFGDDREEGGSTGRHLVRMIAPSAREA